jgi:hypothetical protein
MLLSELTLPVPYDDCKDLALVYSYEVAVQWYESQVEHGDRRHTFTGLALSDGRWMMYGDVLSELYPGGIIGWALPHLTPEVMTQIEVVPMSEVAALLPPESPSPVS